MEQEEFNKVILDILNTYIEKTDQKNEIQTLIKVTKKLTSDLSKWNKTNERGTIEVRSVIAQIVVQLSTQLKTQI